MSLPRSGMFMVVRVCRPEVKVSSALPSRKKVAHWLSWTMSWAPSLMFVEPEGGSRWTISWPVESKYCKTSIAITPPYRPPTLIVHRPPLLSSPTSGGGRAAPRLAPRLPDPAQDRFPLAEGRVQRVQPADHFLHRLGRVGRGRRHRRPRVLHSLEQPEGVAVAGHDLVEALARGLDVVDRVEGPRAARGGRESVEALLRLLEARGQVLPLQTVRVAAQLLLPVPLEAGDREIG